MLSKPIRGTLLNKLHPLAKGLVLNQIFNEGTGTKTFDGSGLQNHGTMHNCAWSLRGIDFNGTSSFINCGNDASLQFGTGDFSIGAWVKTTMVGTGYQSIVDRGVYFSPYTGYGIEVNEGKIVLTTWENNMHSRAISIQLVNDDAWHYVVGIRQGTSQSIYIDGELDKNQTGITLRNINVQQNLTMGATLKTTGGFYFDGTIDEVRIFNRALSADEIWQLYTEPYCMYEPVDDIAALYIAAGQEHILSIIKSLTQKYNQLSTEEHQLLKILNVDKMKTTEI